MPEESTEVPSLTPEQQRTKEDSIFSVSTTFGSGGSETKEPLDKKGILPLMRKAAEKAAKDKKIDLGANILKNAETIRGEQKSH